MNKLPLFAIALCFTLPQAYAQKRAFTIQDIYKIKSVYGFSLSPDNSKLIMAQSSMDLSEHSSKSDIAQMDLKAKTPQLELKSSDGVSYSPVWDKDGSGVFYTGYANGKAQLFHMDIKSGEKRQITDYELGVSSPLVSPDNNYVAFVADVYPEAGADGKKNLELAKKKAEGPVQAHIADKLLYRHWTSYSDGRYQHIIVFDVNAKTYIDVTPGAYVSPVFSPSGADGGFCFSPDSKEICYVSNHTDNPEANTNCDLWTVSVKGGATKCLTPDNPAWDGSPQYSPDGKWIAYRLQKVESYESDRFRLALYNRTTGERKVISEEFDNWVDDYKWSDDSKRIYFLGEQRGYSPLTSVL